MFNKNALKAPLLNPSDNVSDMPPPLPPKTNAPQNPVEPNSISLFPSSLMGNNSSASSSPSYPNPPLPPKTNAPQNYVEPNSISLFPSSLMGNSGSSNSSPYHNPPLPLGPKPKKETPKNVKFVTSPVIPLGYQSSVGFVMKTPVVVSPPMKQPPSSMIMDKCSLLMPISSEEATNALITFVNSNCCYSKKPLSHMTYNNFEPFVSYTITWEDFVETRSFQWIEEPYILNQPIDDYQNGPVPDIWSVEVRNSKPFCPMTSHVAIPHSEFVMKCSYCDATGKIRCPHCKGVPLRICEVCSGNGSVNMSKCSACKGLGKILCNSCSNGYTPCTYCHQHNYLKYHLELICERKVNENIRVIDNSGLPIEYLQFNKGDLDFSEQAVRLSFNNCFNNKNLNFATSELYNASCMSIRNNNTNLIQQRYNLYSTPITRFTCKYNNTNFNVWVLGNNKMVYVPDYPVQKCGFCDIF